MGFIDKNTAEYLEFPFVCFVAGFFQDDHCKKMIEPRTRPESGVRGISDLNSDRTELFPEPDRT